MKTFAGIMQWVHVTLAYPGVLWVKAHVWCGSQWEKLKERGR